MTARRRRSRSELGSVLFTDLVGFTEYTDAAGDAAALGVLDAQTSLVGSVLGTEADSRVVKELGDGLMVWLAHPGTAVDVACRLLEAFMQARADDRIPLAVRMGMHFGEAIVRGADFIGQTVNIASRVSDLAGPGELLVSEAVVAAARTSLGAAHVRTGGTDSGQGCAGTGLALSRRPSMIAECVQRPSIRRRRRLQPPKHVPRVALSAPGDAFFGVEGGRAGRLR